MSGNRAAQRPTVRMLLTATAGALIACAVPTAVLASELSAQTHILAVGDFNGDERSDLLYIARDPGQASGIALTATGPTIDHQSWPSNFLGIPWHSGNYEPVVSDYNGDGRSDLLLHATGAGAWSYLLYTNSEGRFDSTSIHQSIPAYCQGLYWTANEHRIIAGNFVNNGTHSTEGQARRDLLLQATRRGGTNALVSMTAVSTPYGQRVEVNCASSPAQTWGDGTAGFQWSLNQAIVHAGNFNNDGYDDIFVHAKPDIVIIDYDIPFPVPKYRPNSFGIVLANSTGLLQTTAWQYWSRMQNGIDWSAANTDAVVGDFNGDGKADILLQSKRSGGTNYWFATNSSSQVVPGTATGTVAVGTGNAFRLLAANFDGGTKVGIYQQARTAGGGANGYANDITASFTLSEHDYSSVVPSNPNLTNKVTPGTAVGAVPGQFSVNPSGSANYSIPIAVPPGVAGVQPGMSIVYSSRSDNGLLGVGWTITGLSAITRCGLTIATDNVNDGADFDGNDAFCLDGQRLKVLGSGVANGAPNAQYRTELESFQRVSSTGSTAGDPTSWEVWDKAGLIRSYGTTDADTATGDDTRIEARTPTEATNAGQGLVWAVKLIKDRFDNFIEYKYEQDLSKASFWPTEITYGSQVAGTASAKTVVGRVVFTYFTQDRPDATSGYLAGGRAVGTRKLLQKVTVYARQNPTQSGTSAASTKVREYFLNYETSVTSALTHLTSVTLCDGGSGTAQRCFRDTKLQWQHGYRGFGAAYSSVVPLTVEGLKVFDYNGDGRSDYVYSKWIPQHPIALQRWVVHTSSFHSSTETATTHAPKDLEYAVTLDYNSDGYDDLIQRTGSGGTLEVLHGSSTVLNAPDPKSVSARALSYRSEATVAGDFNGDGRQDLAYVAENATDAAQYDGLGVAVQLNTATGLATNSVYLASGKDNRYQSSIHFVRGRKEESSALRVINFDGDGRDDLLVLVNDCALIEVPTISYQCESQARVFSINESGTLHQKWPQSGATYWGGTWSKLKLLDANGDGLTDILSWADATTGWQLRFGTADAASWSVSAWNASSVNMATCFDQWTYFAGNVAPPACQTISYSLTQQKLDDAVAYDYNRDGRTDILYPEGGDWVALPAGGSGFQGTLLSTSRNAIQPGSAMVVDDRADGVPDLLFASGSDPEQSYWHIYPGRGPISGLIEKITDGLGAQTTVQYAALTAIDPSTGVGVVYKGHQALIEGPQPTFPYTHFGAPIPVVYQFSADNGRTNPDSSRGSVRTTYEYYGLKVHRQGRGVLGFSEIRSWNDNTDIQTINQHAQTFPHTGMVLGSKQVFKGLASYMAALTNDTAPNLLFDYVAECETTPHCSPVNPSVLSYTAGGPVSEAASTIDTRVLTDGNRYFPYLRSTTSKVYALTDAGAGTLYKQAKTEYLSASGSATEQAYDEYGNPFMVRVTTNTGTSGVDEHVVTTTNTYTNETNDWCLGRLTGVTVQHQKPANVSGNTTALTSITRQSTFGYQSGLKCVLQTENTEPAADSGQWRLTNTYTYDAYGNRASETVGGYGIVSAKERTTSSTYTVNLGQLPSMQTNAEGHSELPTWDGRFGAQTQVVGPNNLTALFEYDTFGRKVRETPIAGLPAITTTHSHHWCEGTGECVASNAVFAVKVTGSDGSISSAEFDRLGREIRTRTLHFDGGWLNTEKHYDPLGREYLTSGPYRDSQNRCWTFRRFDALGRMIKEWQSFTEEACTASVPSYDKPDSEFDSPAGAWKRTDVSHDLISGNGIATKVVSNASDTTGYATAHTTYRIVNVMDRLRHSLDETTASSCPWNGSLSGSTAGCAMTEFDYDAQGNTTYVKQLDTTRTPNVLTETKSTFNRRGFKTQTIDPDMGTWDYSYNVFGELVWQRDAKLQVTTLDYDELGRTISRAEGSEGTTTWEYDTGTKGIGKLAKVVAPGSFEEHYFYDNFGRLERTKRLMDGGYHWIDQTYDSQGRLDIIKYPNSVNASTSSSAGPDSERLRVQHTYSSFGHLVSVKDAATSTVYWRADEVDVLGNVKKETLGNGLVTQRFYDRVTGYVNDLKTGTTGSPTSAQSMQFGFDQAANLRMRKDSSTYVNSGAGAREEFAYDKLQRLTQTQVFASHNGSTPQSTETYAYDPLGNLSSKGAYTGYQYGARPACADTTVRPHAVYEVTVSSTTRRYCYDANGNLATALNAGYDTVTWWTANLARKVSKGSAYSEFWYDPARARYKQVAYQDASNQTTTLYMAGLYEKLTKVVSGSTTTEHVHYIRAASAVVAIWKRTGSGSTSTSYLQRDHLGSVVAITDSAGTLTERFSFDPWGKRRQRDNWGSVTPGTFPTPAPAATPRGYTGHEQVDALGIVHMNGRVYDAEIGKFLSADPFVQFPDSTQGLNRYSYVDNNPLSYTDPSGFLKGRDVLRMAIIAVVSWGFGYGAAGALGGGAVGTAAGGFVGGFIGGYLSSGGDLQAAVFSGAAGALTAGIGSQFGNPNFLTSGETLQALQKALAHGFVQGAFQEALGGEFTDGFLGGFAGSLFSPLADAVDRATNSPWLGVLTAAVLGGTAAEIGGGNFANGAASAAFVRLFNDAMHSAPNRLGYQQMKAHILSQNGLSSAQKSAAMLDLAVQLEKLRAVIVDLPTTVFRDWLSANGDGGPVMYVDRLSSDLSLHALDARVVATGQLVEEFTPGGQDWARVIAPPEVRIVADSIDYVGSFMDFGSSPYRYEFQLCAPSVCGVTMPYEIYYYRQ